MNYNSKNINVNNIQNVHNIVETQQNKTPISLLNEWAMNGKKKSEVSYTLVAITGNAHSPIFTYTCQFQDKTGILILILSKIIKYIIYK